MKAGVNRGQECNGRIAAWARGPTADLLTHLEFDNDASGGATEVELSIFEGNREQFKILKPVEVAKVPAKADVATWKEHHPAAQIPPEMAVGLFLSRE